MGGIVNGGERHSNRRGSCRSVPDHGCEAGASGYCDCGAGFDPVEDDHVGHMPLSQKLSAEGKMLQTRIAFSKDEVDNLVEFFELEFLSMVRRDDGIDNMRYLTSMGGVFRKLEEAQKRLKAKDPRNGNTAWR